MDFKPKPGSFTAYMEYMNEASAKASPASPMTLLEILSRQSDQSLPVGDLGAQSGMDASRYLRALTSLRESEYIAIEAMRLRAKSA